MELGTGTLIRERDGSFGNERVWSKNFYGQPSALLVSPSEKARLSGEQEGHNDKQMTLGLGNQPFILERGWLARWIDLRPHDGG
jgi:hypothetical protein